MRILTSPLVKTGDTTADIEELIVFSDETLDVLEPEPMTNLDIVEKARLKLYESGFGVVQYERWLVWWDLH